MTATSPRAEGSFVRVPHEYIHLPITPQAKTLLVAFCAYADEAGRSWCSYAQLGEILQRSKASVSNYVHELQSAGLIRCKSQRYGNGFNYRLLITLVGWSDLLAHWALLTAAKKARQPRPDRASSPVGENAGGEPQGTQPTRQFATTAAPGHAISSVPNPERRVQPADRKDPSGPKTEIQKTKTSGVIWTEDDERAWRDFRPSDRDPISSTYGSPSPALLRKVIDLSKQTEEELGLISETEARSLAVTRLTSFASSRNLNVGSEQVAEAAAAIAAMARTSEAVAAAITALGESWKPYWKRLSSPRQITETCKEAVEAAMPCREMRVRAFRALDRAWIAKMHLRRAAERSWKAAA